MFDVEANNVMISVYWNFSYSLSGKNMIWKSFLTLKNSNGGMALNEFHLNTLSQNIVTHVQGRIFLFSTAFSDISSFIHFLHFIALTLELDNETINIKYSELMKKKKSQPCWHATFISVFLWVSHSVYDKLQE